MQELCVISTRFTKLMRGLRNSQNDMQQLENYLVFNKHSFHNIIKANVYLLNEPQNGGNNVPYIEKACFQAVNKHMHSSKYSYPKGRKIIRKLF